MTNSAKTPSSKARKGTVSVRLDSGSIKACFPRTHFADEKQLKLATGIPNDSNWEATANKLQRRLQLELEENKLATDDGRFNLERYREILEEYGLRAKLRVVKSATTADGQLPPKPELSILEVWDMYCEYRKHDLRESTFVRQYQRLYRNIIESACVATKNQDASEIRNWMLKNRNLANVKKVLVGLSKAYQLAIKRGICTFNPYDGVADDMKVEGSRGKTQSEVKIDSDEDLTNQTKAYTWNEVQEILNYVQNRRQISHYYSFLKFKFLTGCRTGEAIAFMFGDIFWDKQEIVFRRTYDSMTKKHYPLKNAKGSAELIRRFPMPKDGELWNLLKSIPQGEPNEIVFKSKTGKIIISENFNYIWRGGTKSYKGIIPALIKEGKLTKYLPCYNTRHTFVTHQVYNLGRDEKIVSAWCGHGEFVSQKHYQDTAKYAMQINPELPANSTSSQKSKVEALEEQVEQMRKMIEELTNKQ